VVWLSCWMEGRGRMGQGGPSFLPFPTSPRILIGKVCQAIMTTAGDGSCRSSIHRNQWRPLVGLEAYFLFSLLLFQLFFRQKVYMEAMEAMAGFWWRRGCFCFAIPFFILVCGSVGEREGKTSFTTCIFCELFASLFPIASIPCLEPTRRPRYAHGWLFA
jgi:hypothetical protein